MAIIRVSVSEAARLFGVSSRTIRRAIHEQHVRYVVVQGRYKLNFEDLIKWSQKNTAIQKKMNANGIGQYIDRWKIQNRLYSPNPKIVEKKSKTKET